MFCTRHLKELYAKHIAIFGAILEKGSDVVTHMFHFDGDGGMNVHWI